MKTQGQQLCGKPQLGLDDVAKPCVPLAIGRFELLPRLAKFLDLLLDVIICLSKTPAELVPPNLKMSQTLQSLLRNNILQLSSLTQSNVIQHALENSAIKLQ